MRDSPVQVWMAICVVVVIIIHSTLGLTAIGGVSGVADAQSPTTDGGLLFQSVAPEGYDDLQVRIRIDRDRTARWSVQFRYQLDDEADRQAFDRIAENVTGPPGEFVSLMEQAKSQAEMDTGRSMQLLNGSVDVRRSVPDGEQGIVEYRLEWTNFAASPTEERVVVGDVLSEYEVKKNETLIIEWSDAFRSESVSPEPDRSQTRAVIWNDPYRFTADGPKIVLTRISTQPDLPARPIAVLTIFLSIFAGLLYRRRSLPDDADVQPDIDEDLLSDEERVLKLLEANGGRMKQQDLLEMVEWSRTKTSDVVNEMHKDGQIEKFRLGRENVIAMPDEIDI